MSTLKEKTLKLVKTASAISETLGMLDRPVGLSQKSDLGGKELVAEVTGSRESIVNEKPKTPTQQLLNQPVFTPAPQTEPELKNISERRHYQETHVFIPKQSSQISALESKLEELNRQNHELVMRSRKSNNELRAVMEQNEILRKESRRHIEFEAQLRAKILAMSQPEVDQEAQQKLVERMRDVMNNLESHQYLNSYRETLHILLGLVKDTGSISPDHVLKKYKDLLETTESVIHFSKKTMAETSEMNKRIDLLVQDHEGLQDEYQQAIKQLQLQLEESENDGIAKEQRWATKCEALVEKYQQCLAENDQLKRQCEQLHSDNQQLAKIASRPDPAAEVVLMSETTPESIQKEKEMYKIKIGQLEGFIETLQFSIEEFKSEIQILQSDISKTTQRNQELQDILSQKENELSQVQDELEDERLKNLKAVEVIKQLQQSHVEKDTPGDISRLEQILHEQVTEFDKMDSKVPDHESQVQVLQFMKTLDSKTSQVEALESKIKDLEKELSKSEKDIQKLKTKMVHKKDKYDVREHAWSERCDKLKLKVEELTEECNEHKKMLQEYVDQYCSIQGMLENAEKANHPLPFASTFKYLHIRNDEIVNQCTQLHSQLRETRQQVETTLVQLENEKRRYESLDHQQVSTLETLESVNRSKGDLEQRCSVLEHERQEMAKKLKLLLQKTITYFQEEE